MFDPYHKWLGIPPEEQPPHHYRLLGVRAFESDADVIANAAEQRMAHVKQYQSGQHSSLSQEILNRLAAAKICLLNTARKEQYDRQLRGKTDSVVPPPVVVAPPPVVRSAPPPPRVDWRALLDWPALVDWPSLVDWRTILQSDRLWQSASAITLGLLLAIAAAVLWHVQSRPPLAVSRPQPASKSQAAAGQTERARSEDVNLGAPAAVPRATSSSSLSMRLDATEPEHPAAPKRRVPTAALARPAAAPEVPAGAAPPPPRPADTPRTGVSSAAKGAPTGSAPPRPELGTGRNSSEMSDGPVYLDDVKEVAADVGWGSLGKHGETGYPEDDDYGPRAMCRGKVPAHSLSMHPPAGGTAYASYSLSDAYRTFRARVGILEPDPATSGVAHSPFFSGEAYSPLTFRVVANGRVLWQSRPIRRSGDCAVCEANVDGARMLELHVECPGSKTFAWAAWIDPRLEK